MPVHQTGRAERFCIKIAQPVSNLSSINLGLATLSAGDRQCSADKITPSQGVENFSKKAKL